MDPFLLTLFYFAIAIIIVIIGLVIFEMLTRKYKDWDEILNNNKAVALSISGKIVGICIILAFAVYSSDKVLDTLIWGLFGVVLQMLAYFIFEAVTRTFSVQEQLKKGNVSIGLISFAVSVGLALVIGASIT